MKMAFVSSSICYFFHCEVLTIVMIEYHNMKVLRAREKHVVPFHEGLFIDKRSANLWYLMYMYLYKCFYAYVCHSTVLVDAVVCSLPTVMEVKVNLCLALFVSFLLNENYN